MTAMGMRSPQSVVLRALSGHHDPFPPTIPVFPCLLDRRECFQIEHKRDHQLRQLRHPTSAIRRFVPVVKPVGMAEHAFRGKPLPANGTTFRTAAAFAVPLGALVGRRVHAQLPVGG